MVENMKRVKTQLGLHLGSVWPSWDANSASDHDLHPTFDRNLGSRSHLESCVLGHIYLIN